MEADATDKLLAAIANVDKKLDEKAVRDDQRFDEGSQRFASINEELGKHREELNDHGARLRDAEKNIRDQAAAQNQLNHSMARAMDVALEAKREASQSADEATKIVKSAIEIHGITVSHTVERVVLAAVKPVADKVDAYEAKIEETVQTTVKNAMGAYQEGIAKAVGESIATALKTHAESADKELGEKVQKTVDEAMKPVVAKTDEMIANVNGAVTAFTDALKTRWIRIAAGVLVAVGLLVGSAAFGWYSADELAKAKSTAPIATPPIPATAPIVDAAAPPLEAGSAPHDASADR